MLAKLTFGGLRKDLTSFTSAAELLRSHPALCSLSITFPNPNLNQVEKLRAAVQKAERDALESRPRSSPLDLSHVSGFRVWG